MTRKKLPVVSRITALQWRLFDRLRHRSAFDLAYREDTAQDFESLRDSRQGLIVTWKKSGEAVPSPVNIALSDDDKLYFRSEPHVAKIKRLERNPSVRVSACSIRGKPLGPPIDCSARVLPQAEYDRAYSILESNWDLPTKLLERTYDRIGVPAAYVEVAPIDRDAPERSARAPSP